MPRKSQTLAYVKDTEILIQEVWAGAPELTFQELPRDGGGGDDSNGNDGGDGNDDGEEDDDSDGSDSGNDSYNHGDDEGDKDSNLLMSTDFLTTGTVLGAGTEA